MSAPRKTRWKNGPARRWTGSSAASRPRSGSHRRTARPQRQPKQEQQARNPWNPPNEAFQMGTAAGSLQACPAQSCSAYPDQLVGLQAQPPLRMFQAIARGGFRIGLAHFIVHGLQEEVLEVHARIAFRRRALLRIDQLQLIAMGQLLLGFRLGTDADPVNAGRRQLR